MPALPCGAFDYRPAAEIAYRPAIRMYLASAGGDTRIEDSGLRRETQSRRFGQGDRPVHGTRRNTPTAFHCRSIFAFLTISAKRSTSARNFFAHTSGGSPWGS